MLTSEIAALADWEQHAGVAFPIQKTLRLKVIPAFLDEIGLVGWRRFTEVITIGPGDRYVVIPETVKTINAVKVGARRLTYIGDNPDAIDSILAQTSRPAAPSVYWVEFYQKLVMDTQDTPPSQPTDETIPGPNGQRMLKFGTPSDNVYDLTVNAWQTPQFTDYASDVQLDSFIPREYQWGLIEGLRYEIYKFRIGVGDPRSINAKAEYDSYVVRARNHKDASAEETPRFA